MCGGGRRPASVRSPYHTAALPFHPAATATYSHEEALRCVWGETITGAHLVEVLRLFQPPGVGVHVLGEGGVLGCGVNALLHLLEVLVGHRTMHRHHLMIQPQKGEHYCNINTHLQVMEQLILIAEVVTDLPANFLVAQSFHLRSPLEGPRRRQRHDQC